VRIAWSLLAVSLSALACECGGRVAATGSDPLRVTPAALDFGEVYSGTSRELRLALANPNRSSTVVEVSQPAAPFSAASGQVGLAGGQEAGLAVAFAPASPGPFDGRLTLTEESGRSVVIPLRGTALPVPECGAAPACWATSFDFDAGACLSARRADGTSCTSSFACFARAECLGGACVGTLTTCDDRNPCTLDACGESGCLHLEGSVECPVPDPCQAAFCDPAVGCSTQPLPDGTLCGAASCRTARVCIAGRCVERPQPNAADECTGVAIAASGDSTCVLTRAGSVRCWGAGFGQPYRVGFGTLTAGQAKVALVDRATGLSMSASACMPLAAGGFQCIGRSELVRDAGAGAQVSAVGNIGVGYGALTCWALLNGSVECEAQPAGVASTPFDGGIVSLAAQPAAFCGVRDDGGVVCWSGAASAEVQGLPAPARALRLGSDLSCALLDPGIACWVGGNVYGLPPDLIDLAVPFTTGQRPYYAAGPLEDGGAVECVLDFSDGGFTCVPMFDAGVLPAVRAVAVGSRHRCVLTMAGDVACAGENRSAQLGDPSVAPPGTHQVPIAGARLVDVGHYGMAVAVLLDGGVTSWGSAVPTSGLPGATAIDLATDGVGVCVLSATGEVRCSSASGIAVIAGLPPIAGFVRGPRATSGFVALTDGGSRCAFSADGAQVRCSTADAGARQQVAGDDVACSVVFDAGVVCEGNNRYGQLGTGTTAPISGPVAVQGLGAVRKVAATLSSACALEVGGRALCWGRSEDGGATLPAAVPGVLPFGRDLACAHSHCCLLVGDNAVSCWGDNLLNQLGREGPSSPQPVAVPMPGRVEQLAAGGYTTCARLKTGAVWCWGDNARGQLGFAPLLRSDAPVWVLH